MADERSIDEIEMGPNLRKVHAQVREHVDVLRSFTGKHEDNLAVGAQWLLEVVNARPFLDLLTVRIRESFGRVFQFLEQIG